MKNATTTNGSTLTYLLPLDLEWNPKEDITTFELAKCLTLLLRNNAVMPYEVDKSDAYMRHFTITDLNRYE